MLGNPHDAAQDQSATRSCDQCRKRKIRCDRSSPCSACTTAELNCTVGLKNHLPHPRTSALISHQYEEKIDRLDVRLRSIEATLQRLSSPPSPAAQSSSSRSEPDGNAISPPSEHDLRDRSTLSGDHTFNVQCTRAHDFLYRAVRQGRVREVNPSIIATLINLRRLMERQGRKSCTSHDQSFPQQRSAPDGLFCRGPIPPVAAGIDLLRRVSNAPPTLFTYNCAYAGITDFTERCKAAYASPQTSSHAELTIVNGGLFYLFVEQEPSAKSSASHEDYRSLTRQCQGNLESCIKSFPLFLSSNVTNVQALLLSVLYAIDVCWPSIAWNLNCTAAKLCIAGGFHRSDCVDRDPWTAQLKASLFWQVYTMDKSLSLRLGHASVIRDCDISISNQFLPDENQEWERAILPKIWLATSSLRALVYEQLYSPGALSTSPDEQINRASHVAVECQVMEEEIARAQSMVFSNIDVTHSPNLPKIFVMSSLVQFYALKTLVYSTIPAPGMSASQFCEDSLSSARKAVEHHLNSVGLLCSESYLQATYVHWTLMMTPFAPFFLLFSHAIETLDMRDLGTLKNFTQSLKSLRQASAAAEELYVLYEAMVDAAQAYQDAFQILLEQEPSDFDWCLGQMDFGPNVSNATETQGTTNVADWFPEI